MTNRCETCAYCYKGKYDSFPTCQYEGPHEWSPCEADDEADRIAREQAEYEAFVKSIVEEYKGGDCKIDLSMQ